jgi:hypothetical protein
VDIIAFAGGIKLNILLYYFCSLFFLMVLEFELMALCLLGRHFTVESHGFSPCFTAISAELMHTLLGLLLGKCNTQFLVLYFLGTAAHITLKLIISLLYLDSPVIFV